MDAKELTITGPHKDFEAIKHLDKNGVEFWYARELMVILDYLRWESFEKILDKAKKSCLASGQLVEDHFRHLTKMIKIGHSADRPVNDCKLDRYACYLIAQNGDSNKVPIAMAQTYFATRTRMQELSNQVSYDEKRLAVRNRVKEENKKLASTAKNAGVTKFGSFNDAGYRGLYELSLKDLERVKGVKKGELLDRAGSTELAANLFRITQTDEIIHRDRIFGQEEASKTHFMVGGKIRQAIKDIGGTMPERLPVEKHIKELKKGTKKLK